MSEMTKIMQCDCKSDFQDSKYGKQNRVFVFALKASNHRCTVCGELKRSQVMKKEEKVKKKK